MAEEQKKRKAIKNAFQFRLEEGKKQLGNIAALANQFGSAEKLESAVTTELTKAMPEEEQNKKVPEGVFLGAALRIKAPFSKKADPDAVGGFLDLVNLRAQEVIKQKDDLVEARHSLAVWRHC